jgi:tryptophan 2,3-dioxygenase
MSQNYNSYLKIDGLLGAQVPLSDGPEHDEMLFIIIHQVYELWFKQLLHEMDHLIECFDKGRQSVILHTLSRVRTIWKTLVSQIDILETMTPLSFLSFRDRLESSSGFQSLQFREVECLLGKRSPRLLGPYKQDSVEWKKLKGRMNKPNIYEAFLNYLNDSGYTLAESILRERLEKPTPRAEVEAVLKGIYREQAGFGQVCERLVDLDEGVQEWRYRHVKMVERTIGNKIGTGGSSGVDYLRSTLFKPSFPDLWTVRTQL